jgi:hypothetical protein
MLCKRKKMEKLAKAKKLGLVLSHYQPLTWVWRVMAWICTPFVFSMTILKAINYPTQPNPKPQFGLPRFAISSQGDLSKGGPTVEHPT